MRRVWLLVLAGCAAWGLNWLLVDTGTAADSDIQYKRDIFPILEQTCSRCHNNKKKDGGLDMSTRETMLKGGHSGPAFVASNVKKSLMLELLEFDEMPPRKEKPRISKEQFEKLKAWIAAGAPAALEKPATEKEPAK